MKQVGILTFHCADNCGAMLQAYGLKQYLKEKKVNAEIIDYRPFFMTGRHWWIPYVPTGSILYRLKYGIYGWKNNLKKERLFFKKRRNMKRFRTEYLIEKGQRKLFFTCQMKHLPYQYYLVGSDQIWNPDITCGLRKAYFGDFENREKEKVIAYAASLGSASLSEEYDKEFSEKLKHVDSISVRESGAIPYIKRFCTREVAAVPDPVFLLNKRKWQEIEKLPEEEGYIFLYVTESNDKLLRYVKKLSKKCGLSIIKMGNGTEPEEEGFSVDDTAGPSEFLGYIHKAGYIITNSFHGIAFSIIYQKKFAAFQHSSVGERITNVLKYYGLENRLYQDNKNVKIDDAINWGEIERKTEQSVSLAEEFLMDNMEQ